MARRILLVLVVLIVSVVLIVLFARFAGFLSATEQVWDAQVTCIDEDSVRMSMAGVLSHTIGGEYGFDLIVDDYTGEALKKCPDFYNRHINELWQGEVSDCTIRVNFFGCNIPYVSTSASANKWYFEPAEDITLAERCSECGCPDVWYEAESRWVPCTGGSCSRGYGAVYSGSFTYSFAPTGEVVGELALEFIGAIVAVSIISLIILAILLI